MRTVLWAPVLGLIGLLAITSSAVGQTPYIGFVYPAGGQQGTTFEVKLGGQRLDGLTGATITGEGVTTKLVKFNRQLSNQEVQLLREQMRELQAQIKQSRGKPGAAEKNRAKQELATAIQKRVGEWINRPACSALSSIAFVEVTVQPGATPGSRELRLVTPRGATNPLVFHVSQLPEVTRKSMRTCPLQVLGKEAASQRKRPPEEEEAPVTVPCVMNGQISSGEVNRYRFKATKGQRLVISADARQLIPYIADAVPGWFQPLLTLHDANGREVGFNDDYRFKPDPTLFHEVDKDGEYVLTITDAIYRGREDFVYRVTIGEQPFITSVFPLGGRVGEPRPIAMEGWNLQGAKLTPPPENGAAGVHFLTAAGKKFVSNAVPFALDTLPECFDQESNNDAAGAQQVELPIIINGRVDQADDWDVFQFEGIAGQTIVAEVNARRLDSPLDSMLKIADSDGKLIALNDDSEDVASGLNTHHADSYVMVELPHDGTYYVSLGDTARNGGKEYAYRLRISRPRPDFELRVVPSSLSIRSRAAGALSVYAIRRDGFEGAIKLELKNPPPGFSVQNAWLGKERDMARISIRTNLRNTSRPTPLTIEGSAKVGQRGLTHAAVAADDRMQAFLWRHLVPAEELAAQVFNPSYKPPPTRIPTASAEEPETAEDSAGKPKPVFTQRQVASRLRQLKLLFEEWLLTDDFYNRKVAECETAL